MLEQKLATLQRLLAVTQEASDTSWQVSAGILFLYGLKRAVHVHDTQSLAVQTMWETLQTMVGGKAAGRIKSLWHFSSAMQKVTFNKLSDYIPV